MKRYSRLEAMRPDMMIKSKRSKIWHDRISGEGTGCGVVIHRDDAEYVTKADFVVARRDGKLEDGERECWKCFEP